MSALLQTAASARATLRFRAWAARTRLSLARAGCDVEIVAPEGAAWSAAPLVEVTRQEQPGAEARRGSLRLELGAGTHLGDRTIIEVAPASDSVLRLGDGCSVGAGVRFVLFGGEVSVGAWSRLRDGTMLKSAGRLTCGPHLILQNQSILHCAERIEVGERVTFGERVSVLDSDHAVDGSDVYTQEQPITVDPVTIGRNAWIGANAVLLRGTRLGRNSVVAAGSVVRGGDYPEGWLIAGAPAEAKRSLGERVGS